MAKKVKVEQTSEEVKNKNVETVSESKKSTKNDVKNNKKENKKSKQDKSKKNKGDKKGLGKRIKETSSELKKVSWPSFGKVVKSTIVVIVVVLFFTIALFGIDYLLKLLFNLLTPNA